MNAYKIKGIKAIALGAIDIGVVIYNKTGCCWELLDSWQLPTVSGEQREVEFSRRDWRTDEVEKRSFTIKCL